MSGSYIDGEDLNGFTNGEERYLSKPISTKEAIMIDKEQYDTLRAENERLTSLVVRLKEDGERLIVDYGIWQCGYCGVCRRYDPDENEIEHTANCPITLHRQLMTEIDLPQPPQEREG